MNIDIKYDRFLRKLTITLKAKLVCPILKYLFLRMLTKQEKMLDIKIQQFSKHQSEEIFKRIFPKRFVMIATADFHGSGIFIKLFPRVFPKF